MQTASCCLRTVFVVALGLIFSTRAYSQAERQTVAVKLNSVAFENAKRLIAQNRFVPDHKGNWKQHRPSANDENEFIRHHGFAEYAKWHLGIDERFPENTKARYKFPYGDLNNVHRCGVLAAESRARQFGYSEVERAAIELLNELQVKAMADSRR